MGRGAVKYLLCFLYLLFLFDIRIFSKTATLLPMFLFACTFEKIRKKYASQPRMDYGDKRDKEILRGI